VEDGHSSHASLQVRGHAQLAFGVQQVALHVEVDRVDIRSGDVPIEHKGQVGILVGHRPQAFEHVGRHRDPMEALIQGDGAHI